MTTASFQLEPLGIDAMIANIVTEAEIFADVLSPNQGEFTVEVAQVVLNWKFSRRSTAHINALARRNQKGTISAAEREELERYLRVGSFLNLLQTKARLSLTASEES